MQSHLTVHLQDPVHWPFHKSKSSTLLIDLEEGLAEPQQIFIEQTNQSSELTDKKISQHYHVGLKMDEGSFLSTENTTREREPSSETVGKRKERISTNTWGESLCDGRLQPVSLS